MTKSRLNLELETENTSADHPASKLFSRPSTPRHRLRSTASKAEKRGSRAKQSKPKAPKTIVKASETGTIAAYNALKRTDKAVIDYLKRLQGRKDTCKASIPDIASACDISERQVQVSTQRLIKAELLERTGYDFGNSDRAERGTIFRVSL